MKTSQRLFTTALAGVMAFSLASTATAAETMTATLGPKDEFTFVFSSGYSVESEAAEDSVSPELYHMAPDGTVTITSTVEKWSATYQPADSTQGGYSIDSNSTQSVTIKYFDTLEKADAFWTSNTLKDTIPAYDKAGAVISVAYKAADGTTVIGNIPLNFDGVGTTSATVPEAPVAPVTPEAPTPAAPAANSAFKSTQGLFDVLPPMPVKGQDLLYQVETGESLYGIAFNYYGSMSSNTINRIWKANASYFKSTRGVLEAGAVLTLPAKGLINPVTPSGIPNAAGTYLVQRGDCLATIAKHFYGNSNLWKNIYQANKDRVKMVGNSPMIYEDQWLIIPNVDGTQYTPSSAPSAGVSSEGDFDGYMRGR